MRTRRTKDRSRALTRHCALVGAFCLTALGALSARAAAQTAGLVVTSLTASRPAAVDHYATVRCVVRYRGTADLPLKALAVSLAQSDGTLKPFGVWPFTNPGLPSALRPGDTYAFREFQRITAPGDYSCAVTAQGADGKWTPLTLAGGRPATVTLHAVRQADIPRVQSEVTDAAARHVYRPGDTIRVSVLPVLTGGPDLSAEVADLTVTTPARPFSQTDPAEARRLLGPADHPGYQADFFGVPDAEKRLDLTVHFRHPVGLASFAVSGADLNGEYGLKACEAEATRPDGSTTPWPTLVTTVGSGWSALSAAPHGASVTALRLRLSTAYKIDVQTLTLTGSPTAGGPVVTDAAAVTCRWQDAAGRPLSPPQPVPLDRPSAVASPPHLAPGYYGLIVTAKIPGQDDTRHEYGFAVLPAGPGPDGSVPKDPRFDFVHADTRDPNLGLSWNKSLVTNFYDGTTQTLDAKAWQDAIRSNTARGVSELPLFADDDWKSDSTRPVSQEQLDRIRAKMVQYFRATPNVAYWELGLEETLGYRGNRSAWVDYWRNLAAKAHAVHLAAADAHAGVKLIYQVAENDPQDVEEFFRSGAAGEFDVLSLHPYWWPDFPTPERWMPAYLAQARASMTRAGRTLPIWFTEIGAPVDADPGGFFGYPGDPGVYDRGLPRPDHAAFTVKCYLVGWQQGVSKIFWYNDGDGGADPEYAEDNFGMIDHWGFPKPTYVAYSTMARLLTGKPLQSSAVIDGNIQMSRFHGAAQDVLAVWTYPAARRAVALAALHVPAARVVGIRDLYGTSVPLHGASLTVTQTPLYILVRHDRETHTTSSTPHKP